MSGPGPAAGSGVRACGLDEIGGGRPVHLDLGGCPVSLVRTAGTVYALRDECTHESVPLSQGGVAGGTIECWLHGSRFDLAAGRVLLARPPARWPSSLPAWTAATSAFACRLAGKRPRDKRPGTRSSQAGWWLAG